MCYMSSTIPSSVWSYLTGTVVALLLCSILLAVILQFKMDRPRRRPWPEGMEPPDEHFTPVKGKLVGRESLEEVIYTLERIELDEKKMRRKLNIPWLVPYKTPSKDGEAWLGQSSFVFYYRYTDDFFHLAYPSITRIDAFHGWYREHDFRKEPALIIHYVAGDNMFCVLHMEDGKMDSLARALASRVEQVKDVHVQAEADHQQGERES